MAEYSYNALPNIHQAPDQRVTQVDKFRALLASTVPADLQVLGLRCSRTSWSISIRWYPIVLSNDRVKFHSAWLA